ncbi:MAG TPA: MBL fold metallo-hydrolase [Nocardioides sp.]|nr:MBL fold metallo-hydrolase [Nocardioides sp.]
MSDIPHDAGFVEVGERCWVARYEYLDVNVGVVAGERGLVVVDTQVSEAAARTVLADLRRLGRGEVVAVVNTHEHFDHTLGNAVFRDEYGGAAIHAHEAAAANLVEAAERAKRLYEQDPADPHGPDVLASRVVVPERTFSSVAVIDLGDRVVEVLHPGRGHTAGDAVVRVGDADVLYAGDLVEESALRNGVPGFGPDCFPMEWPASLDLVVGMLGADTVVVPGHGNPVDRDFVQEQRSAIGVVAETIRDVASRGVPLAEALDATEWPYPKEELGHAVARGYEHLPRGTRSLPLL